MPTRTTTIGVISSDGQLAGSLAELVQRFGDRVQWPVDRARLGRGEFDLIVVRDGELPLAPLVGDAGCPVFAIGDGAGDAIVDAYAAGVAYYVVEPHHPRELLAQLNASLRGHRRIVAIGGGAGLYTLLCGLKAQPGTNLTAVVTVSDDGGSSGRIREAYGILPPGDIRRSLVALSTAPALMNQLFQYRFAHGDGLRDHNLGNLLLTAVAELVGSSGEAVRAVGDILNVQGTVLPVSDDAGTLCAEFIDGSIVRGEHRIDVPVERDPRLRVVRVWLEPPSPVTRTVVSALLAADTITVGPGDLYTSVIAALSTIGMRAAVAAARARTIYICNLMTKPGETHGYTVSDHLAAVLECLGPGSIDDVVVSNTRWSPEALGEYARLGQEPVVFDVAATTALGVRAHAVGVGSERELVRHDSTRLAAALLEILEA